MTTFTDEIRETVSPHKFGGSRMAAACWLISLDGCADEETGDANEWLYHAARIGRRILYTDDQGFVWVDTYKSELEAIRAFEADERSYGEALEIAEIEDDMYREGYVQGFTGDPDEFKVGDAVTVAEYPGIAFRVDGFPTRRGPDYEWSGIEYVNPSKRDCHMVGDDRTFTFDVAELTPLSEDEFCAGCGQICCGWC